MKLTTQKINELTVMLSKSQSSVYSPLALAATCCTNCHGCGRLWPSRKICPCIVRRLARTLSKLTDKWEYLWLQASWFPDYFPPHPVVRSYLGRYYVNS
jgi:hypothetical protein